MGNTGDRDTHTGRPSTSRWAAGAMVAVALAITAVASCAPAGSTAGTTTARSPARAGGTAPTPVAREVQQVCARFVSAALSIDTTTDQGPGDARVRAARAHGVPELAARLQGHGKDPDWLLLTAHRAHVEVTTQPIVDDPPPAQNDVAAAGVLATRVAVGAAHWRHQLSDTAAYCSLRRDPDGWKVADLSFSDSSPAGAG